MATIAKRRDRWVIDFYDHQGKRRWITMPKGSAKKSAKEKLREIEDQIKRGIYLPKDKIPLFKKVAKDWIKFKKPDVRPRPLLVAAVGQTQPAKRVQRRPPQVDEPRGFATRRNELVEDLLRET